MNIAIKKLWAEHLRSDWYDQNFTVDSEGGIPLRTIDNKWSPFGVLCNIHAQTFPDVASEEFDPASYLDYEYLIPSQVAIWAGLAKPGEFYNTSIPIRFKIYNGKSGYHSEIYNSVEEMALKGLPFFMIADIIETLL